MQLFIISGNKKEFNLESFLLCKDIITTKYDITDVLYFTKYASMNDEIVGWAEANEFKLQQFESVNKAFYILESSFYRIVRASIFTEKPDIIMFIEGGRPTKSVRRRQKKQKFKMIVI